MKESKRVMIAGGFIIIIMLLCIHVAEATQLETQHIIRLKVIVRDVLSLNLEESHIRQNLSRPEAEAFSELKDHGVLIEKLACDNTLVWRFTKTK